MNEFDQFDAEGEGNDALDPAIWVADNLEGGDPFTEKNGDVTRYGVGDSGGYSAGMSADSPEAAAQIYLNKYMTLPGIKENFAKLKDPADQAAAIQFALHRPSWAQEYFRANPVGEDGTFDRNHMLDYQEERYRKHPGGYEPAFENRVATARAYPGEKKKIT